MEDIHLVHRNHIYEALNLLYGEEVATHIEHSATIAEQWFILDAHSLNLHTLLALLASRNHLAKTLKSVEYALWCSTLDCYPLRRYIEGVLLLAKRVVYREDNTLFATPLNSE